MRGILRIALAAAVVFGLVEARLALTTPPPETWTPRRAEIKTFVGEMGEKGKEKGDKDTYEFNDGRFHSTACDKYGFGAAPYLVQRAGGKLIFTVETRSKKEGTMTWRLTLDGDTLTGDAVWKKGDTAPREYWVKGTLKK
ncbi:MAG TPA: hypothetical protein VFZ57_06920 [Thermoanaerobaculia bacterium]|nr:hypothetical protein [Thermoanaerobaculia bacterium]